MPMDIRFFYNNRPVVSNPCSIKNGGCSHLCLLALNLKGEVPYTCACPSGLNLREDKKTCSSKMNSYLAIARRSDIRIISLDVPYSVDVKLDIKTNLLDVVDVAIDPSNDSIYFTDIGTKTIQRYNMRTKSSTETIIKHGLQNVEGIAVDPLSKLLYWTDFGLKRIGVSSLDGSFQKVLLYENIESPRAIALHYTKGIMFWTDWAKTPGAKIERANMDGTGRRTVVENHIIWPNGVTVDMENNKIIWCDAMTEKLEMTDLSGRNRVVLMSGVKHAYSVVHMNGYLYWSEWKTSDVKSLNLENTTDTRVLRKNMPSLMGISASSSIIYNNSRVSKAKCSYLDLPTPTGRKCACPTGVKISEDNFTCKELPLEYLLFTTKTSIKRISLESDLFVDVTLPLESLKNIVALDYHYKYQMLFYTDVEESILVRSSLNGSDTKVITSTDIRVAEGLAVDWIADNLYWTDTYYNTISVSRLNGSSRRTLVDKYLEEPRAIALHPTLGIMFWTDWGKKGKIEKSTLAGSQRQVIVKKSVGWPNGLTIDYENSRVYWIDAKDSYDHIESCNFDGSKRIVVVKNTPHGFSLTALGDSLFWTDWTTPYVHSYYNGENIKIYRGGKQELMDIKVLINFVEVITLEVKCIYIA